MGNGRLPGGLVQGLDSPETSERIAALKSIIRIFLEGTAGKDLDGETRTEVYARLRDLLDAVPERDPAGNLLVSGIPFSLVLEAAALVPDPAIRSRLVRLAQSGDERIRQAATKALRKYEPDAGLKTGREERAPVPETARPGQGEERTERREKLFVRAMREKYPGEDIRSSYRPYERTGLGSGGGVPASPMSIPPAPAGKEAAAPQRFVNVGFVPHNDPDTEVGEFTPLKPGAQYYFWVSIGKIGGGISEDRPAPLPDVPEKATLHVAVFGSGTGIGIAPGSDVGEVEISGDGAIVKRQPAADDIPASRHVADRLFFPVRTPAGDGRYEIRCTIYLKQIQLQSRRIAAQVSARPETWPASERALSSTLDYTLSDTLPPDILNRLPEHRVSLFFDIATQGVSRLFIFSSDGKVSFRKHDVVFKEGELQKLIESARERLEHATYKKAPGREPWYRYAGGKNAGALREGLVILAEWGYEFYSKMLTDFGIQDRADIAAFSGLVREPSYIQIALKENPQNFFPAALIYDFPLLTGEPDKSTYTVCKKFSAALDNGSDLKNLTCWGGDCLARQDPDQMTVCPLGFWGFRHILGLPLSVRDRAAIRDTIPVAGNLKVVTATSGDLDPGNRHLDAVREIISRRYPGVLWNHARDKRSLLKNLKESPHIIYFFCHGGDIDGDRPTLMAGPAGDPFYLTPSNFTAAGIFWEETHPLVFINGCHTGDIAPARYLDFIEPLIVTHKAAGVIGTEITIYPEMASVFALTCLSSFVNNRSIGEAVRDARLEVLRTGNPLGLVYNPFALAGLKLG